MGQWEGAVEDMAMTRPNPAFWQSRRVLVTGHTGFKGGWLSLWLRNWGAEVTGYALPPPTTPSLFEIARVGDGMDSRIGDIRDLDAVQRIVADAEPEVLFHLAAQPIVRASYEDPVETFATNVMGTVHVLEAARRCPSLKAVVVVTSDKCYENREWLWGYREDEPMGGHDPYSASKGCAELVASAWRRSFPGDGGVIATARAGNVIGGGDWAACRLVPDMMRAFLAETPAVIRNPHAIRPWQHVVEPLAGYLMLAERLVHDGGAYAGGWNFGPDAASERPVSFIADSLTACWGDGAAWRVDGAEGQAHEAGILKLDSAKARRHLGWQPRWSLDRSLSAVAQWFQEQRRGADMRAVTLAQIAEYMDGPAFATRTLP